MRRTKLRKVITATEWVHAFGFHKLSPCVYLKIMWPAKKKKGWPDQPFYGTVEATGVEPVSEDNSTETSTCIAFLLNLACSVSERQDTERASSKDLVVQP
jgi:hypothetical protein